MVSPDLLRRFKMFRDVSTASLQGLSRQMQLRAVRAGEIICRENEEGRTLFLVVSGIVAVEKKTFQSADGAKVVARLEAGEFFGEMSFLQGTPHSATVVAQSDGELIVMSRESLDQEIKLDSGAALEQVMTLASGLSGRLRSTTRELVTVFEVARAVASTTTIEELARAVVGQLHLDLNATVGFYRWNIYNDELNAIEKQGPGSGSLPATIDDPLAIARLMTGGVLNHADLAHGGDAVPFRFSAGHLVTIPVRGTDEKFGLFAYHSDTPSSFDAGERQMMETVASVMAPALSSLQHREEEAARKRLERSKQGGLSF